MLEGKFHPKGARSGRRHDTTSTFIIFLFVYVARQAEVAELDAFGGSHQHISHGDISAAGRQTGTERQEKAVIRVPALK